MTLTTTVMTIVTVANPAATPTANHIEKCDQHQCNGAPTRRDARNDDMSRQMTADKVDLETADVKSEQ